MKADRHDKDTGSNNTGSNDANAGTSENRLQAMVLEALERAGGVDYLAEQARETPKLFLSLLSKAMPGTQDKEKEKEKEERQLLVQVIRFSEVEEDGEGTEGG